MATDLVTWLRQQLDEDERDAQRRDFHTGMCSKFFDPGDDCSCNYSAFVLAEVEAKRRILDLHAEIPGDGINYTMAEQYRAEEVLQLLAFPYADRDGYDESWRP